MRTPASTRTSSWRSWSFFASTAYLYWAYGIRSAAGIRPRVDLDWLMSFNIWIITAVFVLVNGLLFYFARRYDKTARRPSSRMTTASS